MRAQLHVAKIGGNIIDDPQKLERFLKDFAQADGLKILVHGGGKKATDFAKQLKLPQQLVQGRRVTDAETLKLVTMVYGGLLNKSIVAALIAKGVEAIGVSGADANLVQSKRRAAQPVDYGFVGDPERINAKRLIDFLNLKLTPVFCALTHDGKGQLLNTNADTLAAEIAIALRLQYDVKLYFCFEKSGVLRDINDPHSAMQMLSKADFELLKKSNKIYAGMLPKLSNAFRAAEQGVEQVQVLSAEDLWNQLTTSKNYGTRIISA